MGLFSKVSDSSRAGISGNSRRWRANPSTYEIVLDDNQETDQGIYHDTPIDFGSFSGRDAEESIPQKIREMRSLYVRETDPFIEKRRNFYIQGKFMEDYTDDAPWGGSFRHYYTTYHDLNNEQLRGYFSWRTQARKGVFLPIDTTFAYIYIYELLNGIGADNPQDSLEKMREFEMEFLDSGAGDPRMRPNLHKWMFEFSVLNDLPIESDSIYMDRKLKERDGAFTALQEGADFRKVYDALLLLSEYGKRESPVVKKHGDEGMRMFMRAWECAVAANKAEGHDIFTELFGKKRSFRWYPLSNAIYWDMNSCNDRIYEIGPNRRYVCCKGVWTEERFEQLYSDHQRLTSFMRAADRILRRHFKTGHYLKTKENEVWAEKYVYAAIESAEREMRKASRPKVDIDLTGLDRIREDAEFTKQSLIVEEEADFEQSEPASDANMSSVTISNQPSSDSFSEELPLDALHQKILAEIICGNSADGLIRDAHLMKSIVVDTINEVLFEEIGDNVLEMQSEQITLIEDYREDVAELIWD